MTLIWNRITLTLGLFVSASEQFTEECEGIRSFIDAGNRCLAMQPQAVLQPSRGLRHEPVDEGGNGFPVENGGTRRRRGYIT